MFQGAIVIVMTIITESPCEVEQFNKYVQRIVIIMFYYVG